MLGIKIATVLPPRSEPLIPCYIVSVAGQVHLLLELVVLSME